MDFDSFKNTHIENTYGLVGLIFIITCTFFISAWFKRKADSQIRKKGSRAHPGFALYSAYFEIKSFLYSAAIVIGFILLVTKSVTN